MKGLSLFANRKLRVAALLGLILLGIFVRWGNVPVGIQAIELILNPVIHKESADRHAKRYGEDPLFITAVMKVESNFVKNAKSPRGAIGLMQIMPNTALEMARELGVKKFETADLEEPDTNILIGTYYISKLRKEFDSDDILVLCAYNAGGKNARDWLKEKNKKTLEFRDIKFPETRKFVKDVLSTYKLLKRLQVWRERIVRLSNRKAA